jgi:cyclopropane fatty-acyl-phospholipid synthase-like methyltransferase
LKNIFYKKKWKNYWEDYYKIDVAPKESSLFAKFCLDNYLEEGNTVIELGCGNGRDALFFALNNVKVKAVDQCEKELSLLSKKASLPNLEFVCDDFTNLNDDNVYDSVYSRFTLHSVDSCGEDNVIKWCSDHIKLGGYFLIEARGQNNELYGKGIAVKGEKNAFIYEKHYRRFINLKIIKKKLKQSRFKLKLIEESNGFSPYNGKDEKFLRIVGEKI